VDGSAIDLPMAKNASSSSSAISSLQSPDSRQKTAAGVVVDARSKRPIFRGQRVVVFEWMLDDLSRMLGPHADSFDLHAWFYDLDAGVVAENTLVPQRDGGKWLQGRTMEEAVRRGLPLAAGQTHNPKTAGNVAQAAQFVARGQQ
jgi:hypothetical protein